MLTYFLYAAPFLLLSALKPVFRIGASGSSAVAAISLKPVFRVEKSVRQIRFKAIGFFEGFAFHFLSFFRSYNNQISQTEVVKINE